MNNKSVIHSHYTFHAYKRLLGTEKEIANGLGKLDDVSEVSVFANSEEEALKKVKKILTRNYYRVHKAWECFTDHSIEQEMQMTQLEIMAKALKMHQ